MESSVPDRTPLIRIAESLHCHIPSVNESARRWLCGDALDREAGERHFQSIVRAQAEVGSDFMDLNVDDLLSEDGIGVEGARKMMGHIIELIARFGDNIPPCIDSSDPGMLEWGLEHYYSTSGSDIKPEPLVNSVTINRLQTLDLRRRFSFSVVGMLLERAGDSSGFTDIAGPEVYHETARAIFDHAKTAGFSNPQIFFDPAVGPLGADTVGYTRRTFDGIRNIRTDPDMEGVHVCIGLSNCSDGLPRRLALNRAYLRVAMEYGVDAAILDAGRVTGNELVDGRILKLIRSIAAGESSDALPLLVDFAQGHPRPRSVPERGPIADAFGPALADPDQPLFLLEVVPSEQNVDEIFAMAEKVRDTPFTFTVTDTPGGNRNPGPDTIAVELARITGRQPIVNLSCKSQDRNGLMQRVLALYHQGLRHFFAVTGDYPREGRPSFDLDAVTLLLALSCLRRGLEFPDLLPRSRGALDGLVAGAAISPFKYAEPDLWGQYLKMWKKRTVGADYFISQVGWDVRKFQELKLFMNRAGMGDVPLIGSVYFLTPQVLKALSRVHVAGVVIPDELKKKFEGKFLSAPKRRRIREMSFAELAEYHHQYSIRQAALLTDVLIRGFGYRGVDLGGISVLSHAMEILEVTRELGSHSWRDSCAEYLQGDGSARLRLAPDAGFYLFPQGEDGLLEEGPFRTVDRSQYRKESRWMRQLHHLFFEPGCGLSGLMNRISTGRNGRYRKALTLVEQAIKSSALGCEMCGDCRIPQIHYMCPEPSSGCHKRLLNGPCAGADVDGMCEVDPERRCYWGTVMEAALSSGGVTGLSDIQPPKDPRLQHTSSWRNEALRLCPEPLDLGSPDWEPSGKDTAP